VEWSRVEISAVGNQLGSCSDIGDSQRGPEFVNTKVDVSTALEAVIQQRLVKTQEIVKV
jgi:hypothetical protein